jgi:hypothetical protein
MKQCIYCKKDMIYGLQKQVLCQSFLKDGKRVYKTTHYELYGWRCPMETDNCDNVFEAKDANQNRLICENASNELQKKFEQT